VKKLTSERLGREGLAAWEERKSNADPEVAADAKDEDDTLDESEETTKTEPEVAVGAEPAVTDEEAQMQHGTNESRKSSNKSLADAFLNLKKEKRAIRVCDRSRAFRCLQEGDAVQGDILTFADQ
jgi:hypothetical protein